MFQTLIKGDWSKGGGGARKFSKKLRSSGDDYSVLGSACNRLILVMYVLLTNFNRFLRFLISISFIPYKQKMLSTFKLVTPKTLERDI